MGWVELVCEYELPDGRRVGVFTDGETRELPKKTEQ
jgi:hypothetical protein